MVDCSRLAKPSTCSLREARAAAGMGIRVRTCVDAVLEDPAAREELRQLLE
jgi:hypothetical protein